MDEYDVTINDDDPNVDVSDAGFEPVAPSKIVSSEEVSTPYDADNPNDSDGVSTGIIERGVAESLREVKRPKVNESQFGKSVEGLSERAIATRMGVAPGKLRERIDVEAGKTQPLWSKQKGAAEKVAAGAPIRDVRFKKETPYRGYNPLPAGVEGPVLPLTTAPKSAFRPENVEVFDPSETVQTGNPEFPSSLKDQRAPVEDVIQQQATKRASEAQRDYEPQGKRVGAPAAPVSVKSKYDAYLPAASQATMRTGGLPLAQTGFASDEGLAGPAAPVPTGVRSVTPTGRVGNERYAGPGIDPSTGGVELTGGVSGYGPPKPSSATVKADVLGAELGETFGKYDLPVPPALKPDVKMDYGRQVTINGKTYGVSRPALRPGHPLTEKWIKERGDAAAAAAPTETPLTQAGGGARGGQRAIRARQEALAPGIKDVRMPVREEIERAEMFGEDVMSRAMDIYTGVGLEPRDPENLRRRGPSYIRVAEGADPGGLLIPKALRPGKGAVTTEVPRADTDDDDEVEEPKTIEEKLQTMSGADILEMASGGRRSLEVAPAGQIAPINQPGVRGKISDVARIQQEATVQGIDVDDQELAALTVLPETTRRNIEGLMRPDLIGTAVSGQSDISGIKGITEVRKILKGGDEAARNQESRNRAISMTAREFARLPEGVEGPVLPATKANLDAVLGRERARRSQAEGSFAGQPGEQGREGRARRNLGTLLERTVTGGQREADEAVNRALGLAGPGGGTSPAPRTAEDRRRGGRS
jgi:hypothetical protein